MKEICCKIEQWEDKKKANSNSVWAILQIFEQKTYEQTHI